MARPGPDPTSLLRLYIKHDRLEDAADLAVSFLAQWECQVSEVSNSRPRVLMIQWGLSSLLRPSCLHLALLGIILIEG